MTEKTKKLPVLLALINSDMGLYDRQTTQVLEAFLVVELTAFCRQFDNGLRAILRYTADTQGPIVQLANLYDLASEDIGLRVHFHFEQMGADSLCTHEALVDFANDWGIEPHELVALIFANAPDECMH